MGKARPGITPWMRLVMPSGSQIGRKQDLKRRLNVEGDCRCEMWHENRHYFKDLLASGLAENVKARLGERVGKVQRLQTCTQTYARHPLDESNSEYTDSSTEKTGEKKKLPHGKSKGQNIFYSIAHADDLNNRGKTKALLQQKAGECAYPEYLAARGLKAYLGPGPPVLGWEERGSPGLKCALTKDATGEFVMNVTVPDLKTLRKNSAFWKTEAIISLY
ncbi:hypothetical protein llap_11293 [Limosa lapponica baueri]|uniref:Uncharacterized protein n=1 Tax=Limosa lapponica baueri TaxID=1758121 RepID=A0A2I0TXH7_LIMLA|nr:hypothetical protein llap_11293 [Limosa lapponica baueri]